MAKRLKECKRQTDKIFKMPSSVQDTIPINRIAENGIFELENKPGIHLYDRVYIYEDINFSTQDEAEKEATAENFKKLLNSMNVSYKIIISNQSSDLSNLKNNILQEAVSEEYEPLARAYNNIAKDRIIEGRNGMEQIRYFVITCLKQDYESAKSFFNTMEASLTQTFRKLGSGLIPLNASQRLRALHSFYRMGKESLFGFDWDEYIYMKRDWRNDIINTSIKEHKDYLEMDHDRVVSILFVRSFASGLSDSFLKELTDVPFPAIVTMDCDPVDNEYAFKLFMDKYMATERSIDRQQETKNKNGAYSTDVSYDKRKEKEELEEYLDEIRAYDAKMFYVGITIAVSADNIKQLKERIDTIKTIGSTHNMEIEEHEWNQLDALNTTLPTGARFVNTMRALFTDSLTVFMPFNVQEISHKKGFYYGINQVSKNLIMGNRKKLKNGNGFIFGVPGAGKSEDAKLEMGQVLSFTKDDVTVIDPKGEYEDITDVFKGQYVKYTQSSDNKVYSNPFHVPEVVEDEQKFISEKAEFAYAICEQAIKPDVLTSKHISVIDRAVKNIYEKYFESRRKLKKKEVLESPTFVTLREYFSEYAIEQDDEEAKDLAKQLEVFTTGTLNIFTHQQTIEEGNRFTVYGLSELGKKMRALAMLVVIETITSKIQYNAKYMKATWVYVDEAHELFNDEYALLALEKLWRIVRSLGGICTGITQNIIDSLRNRATKTMISNSEYTVLLDQGSIDRDALQEVFDVSNTQLSYVNGAQEGCGLRRFGNKIVPFNNVLEKGNELYEMFNTNFHEKAEAMEKR